MLGFRFFSATLLALCLCQKGLGQDPSFPGGSGRGDAIRKTSLGFLSGNTDIVGFPGGSGRGDANNALGLNLLSGQVSLSYPGGSGDGYGNAEVVSSTLTGLIQILQFPGGSGRGDGFRVTSSFTLGGIPADNISFAGGSGRGDVQRQSLSLLLNGTVLEPAYPGGSGDGDFSLQTQVLLLGGTPFVFSYPGGSGRGDRLLRSPRITLAGVLSPGFARTAVSDIRDFRLIPVRNRTRLFWQTAGGARTDYYRVEQSRDGHDFSPVGFVSGSSNLHSGAASSHYSFPIQPGNGTAWFRLLQVFADSSFAYSPVLQSSGNMDDTPGIQLWPNPVEGRCRLIPRKEGDVDRIRLFDASGRALGEIPAPPSPGGFDLDLAHLVPGLYWLEVEQGNESNRIRFVRP